jgi:hypothetical protein
MLGDALDGALSDPTELNKSFRHEVDPFARVVVDFVKKLVHRIEIFALHIPMRLFRLKHHVDAFREALLQQVDGFESNLLT